MEGTEALRWSVYYRMLATLSFLIGMGIVAAGLWIGVENTLVSLATDLQGGIETPNNPIVAGVGVVVGIGVWQVGKAAAFYKTLVEATQTELEEDLDHEAMKSDMLEVLDERLSDMHAEVEQARRGVNRLQQEEHADQFMDAGGAASQGGAGGQPSYQDTGGDPSYQSGGSGTGTGTATDEPPSGGTTEPADGRADSPPASDNRSSEPGDPNAAFDDT